MTNCQKCGSYVTPGFVRVFGNNEREVFGCPRCTPFSVLIDGGAAEPEP